MERKNRRSGFFEKFHSIRTAIISSYFLIVVVSLAVFALVYLGRTLVDYSVPAILRSAIPVQIAGPYNAWRMLLHNGGTLLATTIAAFIPVTWLLVLTVVFQLFSGFHYFVAKDLRADP